MQFEKKGDESALVALLATGSEHAFKLLYEQYSNKIYKLSIRYLKSPTLAQEIVQDVFLKLWFERKNMIPAKPIEAWLMTVAKNKLINQFRKLANEYNSTKNFTCELSTRGEDAAGKLMTAEMEQEISSLVSQLPQMQQQVYHFAKNDDLSYNQIASRLQISPLTVKTHMARALDKIRKSLKRYGLGN